MKASLGRVPEARSNPPRSAIDRALASLGCNPLLISDILGDLREEYSQRSHDDGAVSARLWYAREIVRSIPHLVLSTMRSGSPAARARMAGFILAAIVTLALITIAWVTRNGPPARLATEAAYAEGVVVNNMRPVRLSVGVFDAAGHRLTRTDIRYRQVAGPPVQVSDRGVVKCSHHADIVIRAYLGALSNDFVVHCQPIKELRRVDWGNFVVGEPPRALLVDAIGPDSEIVTRIAARLSVFDSTVATLNGGELRPLRPGFTGVDIEIGDLSFGTRVTVYERVATFDGLRPDQRWVVAPIHLTRGQAVQWTLPVGDFFIAFGSDSTEMPIPRAFSTERGMRGGVNMSVEGPIMCMPELRPGVANTHCLARAPGATLTISHPGRAAPNDVVGLIAMERSEAR